jgi:hypothetical protein
MYEALSYEWGDPAQRRHDIYINEEQVSIRENLWLALRRVTQPNVFLWVDALCINQDDVVERAQQLAVMGDIFAGAERVRVWLGEDTQVSVDVEETRIQKACRFWQHAVHCGMAKLLVINQGIPASQYQTMLPLGF